MLRSVECKLILTAAQPLAPIKSNEAYTDTCGYVRGRSLDIQGGARFFFELIFQAPIFDKLIFQASTGQKLIFHALSGD